MKFCFSPIECQPNDNPRILNLLSCVKKYASFRTRLMEAKPAVFDGSGRREQGQAHLRTLTIAPACPVAVNMTNLAPD